jgi:lipopolysaccharide export system permease protein
MPTLARYLLREISAATVFVLAALLGIFALFDVINQLGDLGKSGYQFGQALVYVALLAPSHAYELMPIAALIGTIYALSRLAANSEFTIMRVSGRATRSLALVALRIGLIFVALTYAFGEVVAPPSEDLAQRFKLRATGSGVAWEFRSGFWVRDLLQGQDGEPDRLRFVNVQHVNSDGTVEQWRIYEFDSDLRLRSMSAAASGRYEAGRGWLLSDVVDTKLSVVAGRGGAPAAEAGGLQTRIVREPLRMWRSGLTPEIFGVLLVQPERLSALRLARYIRHLEDNHQRTDRYEIAFWKKVLYPLFILSMMALALPFAFLHVRAGTVSLKIFAGIMIGVLFYAINKLFSHLGLINTWPPLAVAALPALVAVAFAMASLYWVERR